MTVCAAHPIDFNKAVLPSGVGTHGGEVHAVGEISRILRAGAESRGMREVSGIPVHSLRFPDVQIAIIVRIHDLGAGYHGGPGQADTWIRRHVYRVRGVIESEV